MKSDKKKSAEAEVAEVTKSSNKNLYIILGVFLAALIGGGVWWFSQPAKFDVKKQPVGDAKSPTEAYKMLFAAVKNKDTEKIKAMMSENSIGFAGFVSGQQKKTIEEVLANGFTATTFQENLPPMRDERIKDGFGALEVQNKDKVWEDLPFIYESQITVESAGANREAIIKIVTDDMKIPAEKAGEFVNQLPQSIGGYTNVQAESIKQKLTEAGAVVSIKNLGWKLAIGDMFKGSYQKPAPGQSVKEQEAANSTSNNLVPLTPPNANNGNVQMIVPKNGGTLKNMPNIPQMNNTTAPKTNTAPTNK
ncbi:MAG TPA: ribosomal protein L7/L12 [Pyrinomonadaceae bacterium]|nr:ribosomal protein L7/L12 [Pyrinomonadaceae bacterium]